MQFEYGAADFGCIPPLGSLGFFVCYVRHAYFGNAEAIKPQWLFE